MKGNIYQYGYWFGTAAFAATVAFVVVQLMQLLRLLPYPFDEGLIYGFSLCIVIPFVMEMLALHYSTPEDRKYWSHAALIFTVIYAVFVTANYVVQLATVIPATLRGASAQIGLLVQTPHSMFWDYDAIGYISMGIAMLLAAPVFGNERADRRVKMAFIANALVVPLIAIVYFYPVFSEQLLLLGLPWGITAPLAMLMLALWFKQNLNVEPGAE